MRILIPILVMLTSSYIYGQTLTVSSERTIRMVGQVDNSYLPVVNQIDYLSSKSADPIFLLINSPGGSIFIGNLVINAMHAAQARGVEFHCASTLLAASMAFQFYVECDHRYAMKHTKLLFHPPRIFYMGTLLANQMRAWLRELTHIEAKMIPVIQNKLGMSDSEFSYHYHQETLWDAEDLKDAAKNNDFIILIEDIKGIADIFQYMSERGGYQNGLIWIMGSLNE